MTQVPVAIIGVGALFPGSPDGAGFWRDIVAARDLVTDVPASHWLIEDYYDPDPSAPDKTYSRIGGGRRSRIAICDFGGVEPRGSIGELQYQLQYSAIHDHPQDGDGVGDGEWQGLRRNQYGDSRHLHGQRLSGR